LRKPKNKFHNADGFTLIEMILVLVFMALIAGLSLPFVGSTLDRIQLQSEVREIRSALGFARSQAITLKTPSIFNGDLNNNQYWLSIPRDEKTTRIKSIEESVKFKSFTHKKETLEEDIFQIYFYPLGNSSGGMIELELAKSDKEDAYYEIIIDPIIGNAKINKKEP
jgi:prepilin-type N-terminal cleavage/methylation domain-containing protein